MRLIPLAFLLSACAASPNVAMMGAEKVDVAVAGRTYTVWHDATRVEVVRHGWAAPGEMAGIRETMLMLATQVTGCTVSVISGDSGEMRGRLSACSR